jgi:hypothetical protein
MRVIFVCGSLEPGRDGVGDYTRRLAKELIRQGHECRLTALNDQHITEVIGFDRSLHQDGIPSLRLPAITRWKERTPLAHKWIQDFTPDWISLQYVPYSFQRKGLPIGIGSRLKCIAPDAKWHIMLHELWIGMEMGTPLRKRLVGEAQRMLIRRLLKGHKFDKISTQSLLYVAQLKSLRVQPRHLPLFGNIPRQPSSSTSSRGDQTPLHFVLFGGIHQNAPISEFAHECAAYGTATGRKVRLTLAGRSGTEGKRWEAAWRAAGLMVEVVGECSTLELSHLFQSASFGIATTPLALIEKSGSAAAMREHSLPVISVSRSWIARGGLKSGLPYGVFEYRPTMLAQVISAAKDLSISGPNVETVAHQFTAHLEDSQ